MHAEAGLLNKRSSFAPALGLARFIIVSDMIWSHFVVPLKSDLGVQQTHLWPVAIMSSNWKKNISELASLEKELA